MLIEGKKGKYELTIGLEVHCQLKTDSKLFSEANNSFSLEPNSNVAAFDIAIPGILPTLNYDAVLLAAKVGYAIGGVVHNYSRFDRKHYFYPDLSSGYQITQFYKPIVTDGSIVIDTEDGGEREISIERIHLEQDAGKLIHDKFPDSSCVDYNRAGIPLIEIVTGPDLHSPYEASEYLKELRHILRYVDASDADMEKGSFRCDANISVAPVGSSVLGTRCEVKNLNSFRFIEKAIIYEANRQIEVIESGGTISQQTRLFDSVKEVTNVMRDKSDAADYLYFPDPDLLPVLLNDDLLESIKSSVSELPRQKRDRYIKEYGLLLKEAKDLILHPMYCQYFEHLIDQKVKPKNALGWVMSEFVGRLKKDNKDISNCSVTKERLSELISFIDSDVISGKIAKDVLDEMLATGDSAGHIIDKKGLKQVNNTDDLLSIVRDVIANNPKKAEEYKSGRDKLIGFFVGECMKATKGSANPKILNGLILQEFKKN